MTTSPHGPMLLVANPRAGTGRDSALAQARATLTSAGVAHRVVVTRRPGHATHATRRAVTEEGVGHVVAVGGDGTVHEVVNGLVDVGTRAAVAPDVVLGVVPGGSGSDFVRTWGLDLPVERLVRQHLLTDVTLPLDVGLVTHRDADGRDTTTAFANVAQCGWGADVVRLANRLPRRVGRARYLAAAVASTVRMRPTRATVTVDHAATTEPITQVVVANGQFFGSGIRIAPRALPDDGVLNVQTWRVTGRQVIEHLPAARVGEHLSSPDVRQWQSSTVTVTADEALGVEADGEPLGTTPARFEVLQRVLRLSA